MAQQNKRKRNSIGDEEAVRRGHAFSGDISAAGEARQHNGDHIHIGDYYTSPAHADSSVETLRRECINSLHYDDITEGWDSRPSAHQLTCEWIWSDEFDFKSWIRAPDGIYWVQGYPGSGKSTLIKHIVESPKLQEELASATLGNGRSIIASFSFDFRRSDIARSREGMLRSLLWQILKELSTDEIQQTVVLAQYNEMKLYQPKIAWSLRKLEASFKDVLSKNSHLLIFVVIDGLDEHQDDKGLAEYLDNFANDIPSNLRLCVASRPQADFTHHFQRARTVLLQEHTKDDIATYVFDRFSSIAYITTPAYYGLMKTLVDRARGVFLWVRLACDELERNMINHKPLAQLKAYLYGLPTELNDMYAMIFRQLDPDEREELGRMLDIISCGVLFMDIRMFCLMADLSKSGITHCDLLPVSIQSCQSRMNLGRNWELALFGDVDMENYLDSEENVDVLYKRWQDSTMKRLRLAGKGLIEIYNYVDLLHETVDAFWEKNRVLLWPTGPTHGGELATDSLVTMLCVVDDADQIPSAFDPYVIVCLRDSCIHLEDQVEASIVQHLMPLPPEHIQHMIMIYLSEDDSGHVEDDELYKKGVRKISEDSSPSERRRLSLLNLALAFELDRTAAQLRSEQEYEKAVRIYEDSRTDRSSISR